MTHPARLLARAMEHHESDSEGSLIGMETLTNRLAGILDASGIRPDDLGLNSSEFERLGCLFEEHGPRGGERMEELSAARASLSARVLLGLVCGALLGAYGCDKEASTAGTRHKVAGLQSLHEVHAPAAPSPASSAPAPAPNKPAPA